jgi:hypothetical protein
MPPTVRLVELADFKEPTTPLYACLSYCWGSARGLNHRSNLVAHKKNIPWESLPKIYQDAIEFSIALQLNYIWIDSLCILQNNKTDWHREAGRMADIYRSAWITIAATKASDDTSGCYMSLSDAIKDHQLPGFHNLMFENRLFIGTTQVKPVPLIIHS